MALVKCKECGAEISSSAKTCPHCGKKQSRAGLGSVIIAVIILLMVLGQMSGTASKPAHVVTAAEQAEKDRYSERLALVAVNANVLKRTMKNPYAFDLKHVYVTDDGAGCYEYLAQNGFGGSILGHAVFSGAGGIFKTDEMPGFQALWDKNCANYSGVDQLRNIKMLMSADDRIPR